MHNGRDDLSSDIHRDLKLSYLAAPLRFVAPILGYLALYPIILEKYGLEVLGLWGLLAAIPQALESMDMGFSLILTRDVGGQDSQQLQKVYRKYRASQKVIGLILLIIAILASFVAYFGSLPSTTYQPSAVREALLLMVVAVAVQRFASLDMAILNGRGDNYFVHFTGAVTPVLFLSIAILGAWFGYPLQFLAIGYIATNLTKWLSYKIRIRNRHRDWHNLSTHPKSPIRVSEIVTLVREGAYLYAASLGMLLRDPILRYTVGALLGLESVAIYEIAMRIGRTGRDIVASGFSALFPSFAVLMRKGSSREIELVTRESLFLLIAMGGSLLGAVYIFAPWIFDVWLDSNDSTLTSATRIVCAWSAMTLCNMPFWYQLIAGNGERDAARAIWLHTISVFALFPLVWLTTYSPDLSAVLLYWLAGSIATQILIFLNAQKRFGTVVITFRVPYIYGAIISLISAVMLLTVYSDRGSISLPTTIVIFGGIVTLILGVNYRRILFWLVLRKDSQLDA